MTLADNQPTQATETLAQALDELTHALEIASQAREQAAQAQQRCAAAEAALAATIDRVRHVRYSDGSHAENSSLMVEPPASVLDGPWITPIDHHDVHCAPEAGPATHAPETTRGDNGPAITTGAAAAAIDSPAHSDGGGPGPGGRSGDVLTGTLESLGIGTSWFTTPPSTGQPDTGRPETGEQAADARTTDATPAAGTGTHEQHTTGVLASEHGSFAGILPEHTSTETIDGTTPTTAGVPDRSLARHHAESHELKARMLLVPLPLFASASSEHAGSESGGVVLPMRDPEIAIDAVPDVDTTGHLPPIRSASSLA